MCPRGIICAGCASRSSRSNHLLVQEWVTITEYKMEAACCCRVELAFISSDTHHMNRMPLQGTCCTAPQKARSAHSPHPRCLNGILMSSEGVALRYSPLRTTSKLTLPLCLGLPVYCTNRQKQADIFVNPCLLHMCDMKAKQRSTTYGCGPHTNLTFNPSSTKRVSVLSRAR